MSKPRGILCPKCGTKMIVYNTKRPSPGLVVRYRDCPNCKRRVRTEEKIKARS